MYINDTGRWTEVITNALFIKYPNLFYISYHDLISVKTADFCSVLRFYKGKLRCILLNQL